MSKVSLKPLSTLKISQHLIPRHGLIPNTTIHDKPLLIYHTPFPPSSITTTQIEAHLNAIGACVPQWRYTMYTTTHFHSTTHELLIISRGSARLLFGGEENPGKVEVEVTQGDAVLVPAGVGHRRLESDEEFEMVGAYPVGSERWDMCYGKQTEEGVEGRIKKLHWFEKDPLYGEDGPVLDVKAQ